MSARAAQRKAPGSASSGEMPFNALCSEALMLMRHPGHVASALAYQESVIVGHMHEISGQPNRRKHAPYRSGFGSQPETCQVAGHCGAHTVATNANEAHMISYISHSQLLCRKALAAALDAHKAPGDETPQP